MIARLLLGQYHRSVRFGSLVGARKRERLESKEEKKRKAKKEEIKKERK